MKIQINTDSNIEGSEKMADHVRRTLRSALGRGSDHITRVEVHLSDENSHKRGHNDKRCMMEVRIEGRRPIAVSNQAGTLDQAIEGAVDKLTNLIESTFGRQRHQRRHRTDPPSPEPKLRAEPEQRKLP